MSREKAQTQAQLPPVKLDLEDPAQAALWDFYQEKTHKGHGADWIRSTLIAALPARAGKASSRHEMPVDLVYEDSE